LYDSPHPLLLHSVYILSGVAFTLPQMA